MKAAVSSLVLHVVLAGPVAAQDIMLLPHVEYIGPYETNAKTEYQCTNGTVKIAIIAGREGLRVSAYSNAVARASDDQLNEWNRWLSDIRSYSHHELSCQAGDNQLVDIVGIGRDGLTVRRVTVWWQGSQTGLIKNSSPARAETGRR